MSLHLEHVAVSTEGNKDTKAQLELIVRQLPFFPVSVTLSLAPLPSLLP